MKNLYIRQFIIDHLLLIKILELIFEYDYKFVRPSRFFTSDTPLCGSIFLTVPYHDSLSDIKYFFFLFYF